MLVQLDVKIEIECMANTFSTAEIKRMRDSHFQWRQTCSVRVIAMSLERTYKSLERNRAGIDRHKFLLLTAIDTLNPAFFFLLYVF
jgi:hypothetical protein